MPPSNPPPPQKPGGTHSKGETHLLYESRKIVESKTPGFEGVKFIIHRFSEGRRIALRLQTADALKRLEEIAGETALLEAGGTDKEEQERRFRSLVALGAETDRLIHEQINPTWLRWGIVSIEGLEIDNTPATAESLFQSGPRELYAEAVALIKEESGLSAEDQKNSESPTTSSAPVVGATSDSGVENANAQGTS